MSEPEYLTRKEAAAYLQKKCLKISDATLATLASRGGGPLYTKFGQRCLYTPQWLDQWVESRLQPVGHNAA